MQSEFITWQAPDDENPARRAAQRSYDAVGRKARSEWLDLFADDAVLEDPVGPSAFDPEGRGHRGKEAIGAFWDAVIAPVKVFHFTIRDSFANDVHCANIGTFRTELADGTLADTDLIATYRVDGSGRIAAMRAHWEMDRTLASIRVPGA